MKKLKCDYCSQKPQLNSAGKFEPYNNQKMLVDGGWTGLYMGVDADGRIVLRACGDDYTDNFPINYCPICGKKLSGKV